ncbi:MAG TPA: hypothetical protein VF210_08595 [Pseudomonadales bacterium]
MERPGTGRRRTSAHPRGSMVLLAALLTAAASPASSAAASSGDANILETRGRVAAMAEESVEMLKSELALEGVEGWAVINGDSLPPDLAPGIGMAQSIEGEAYFLRTPERRCLTKGHRHVLVFRDPDAFREFRQGELQGDALERMRSEGADAALQAYRFRPAKPVELEPLNLAGCRFALHRDLQRALVAEPSETEGMVKDDHVDVDEQ